jgi:hypothetical protein
MALRGQPKSLQALIVKERPRGMTVVLRVDGPDWAFKSGAFASKLERRWSKQTTVAAKLLLTAIKRGYPFNTLRDSWRRLDTRRSGIGMVEGGVTTADPLFKFVEYNTTPHWPALNRGRPGTGIEGWVKRLPVNPLPGYDRPITPYLVARSIAQHGTEGKLVANRALAAALNKFSAALLNEVAQLVASDE